ncbi:hypothetical protein K2173_021865 [Erythroxylum novogranatense]|uniref:RRM domain-containing protein n=1 Tax=Erythroxylum novogranatense TaxID=1862640 RepID=A0AAV8T251_9ROSI|nr:hypothetical protein K2173_021865 [Erythroxylum novogranatense]
MAVAENAGARNGSSGQNFDSTVVSSDPNGTQDLETSKPRNDSVINSKESNFQSQNNDQSVNGKPELQEEAATPALSNGKTTGTQMQSGFGINQQEVVAKSGGFASNLRPDSNGANNMNDLVEMLSKLNPMAEEFVPPSLASNHGYLAGGFGYTNNFVVQNNHGNANGHTNKRKKNVYTQGRRRMNSRTGMAQREEIIRRTVYVSDIDQQVTEEQLAGVFVHCGQVVDCRICGDPNSVLRFAFIEFTDEESARAALNLSGTVLGFYPLRVLPSKTAIAPVNPTFLPRSEDEREMCARTVYCTNIDKKVTQTDVRLFFESFCGEIQRLRLLGDYNHSTRIAFVEFTMAESAITALNCSGVVLGSLPIRVSPSKTPVRPRILRQPLH